ncbi:helix-turn-helix domain-containing protein [Mucilaginibacter ximonensis]|uniref:Helix-turn-helix domain-containing protein n=1 Tax=Mucilaginibacter ximonensis TaxID=538021 RepID=A0ABW5Y9P4_9SPHI
MMAGPVAKQKPRSTKGGIFIDYFYFYLMTGFRFLPVAPLPVLAPYVAKMYVFESGGRLPEADRKLIVPNANLKLTLTYSNGIAATIAGQTYRQAEHQLSLTGLIDTPVNLDPTEDRSTGTIIIEFYPLGAYRFFKLPYGELQNQILDLQALLGPVVRTLQEQLGETETPEQKLELLQAFLLYRLSQTTADPIFDYCMGKITATNGLISVSQLEKETGYSSRWLHNKFSNHLGTGPKNLAELLRFKQVYQAYTLDNQVKENIYQYYHDQSHFLKAFKRFTGATPTALREDNELAARHYRA